MDSLNRVDKRVLVAAAVGVTAIGAGIYLRRQRQQTKAAEQDDAAATSTDSRWQAPAGSAAADGGAAPDGGAAAEGSAGSASQATPPDAAASTGAAAPEPVARGVSTLHASGRVRRAVKALDLATGLDPRWCWSEDETDVVLEIASDVKSAKDVRVKFEPTYLALSVNGECIIDGRLSRPVHAEECSWQFEGSGMERTIVITLVKALASVSWDTVIL